MTEAGLPSPTPRRYVRARDNREYVVPLTPLGSRIHHLADVVRQDASYTVRSLSRSPTLVITILMTIALGVGAVGAVFSVLDRIFFQVPPGVHDPGAVSRIVLIRPTPTGTTVSAGAGLADISDFRAATAGLATIEAYDLLSNPPFIGGRSKPHSIAFTTTGYFALLGVRPALGRFYSADENRMGQPTTVLVLAYSVWQARYGGDTAVLGRTVPIDGVVFHIIGVAQAGFAGLDVDATDMWAPLSARDAPFASVASFSRGMEAGAMPWELRRHIGGPSPILRMTPGADRRALDAALSAAYRSTAVGEDADDSTATVRTAPLIEARGPHEAGAINDARMGIVLTVTAVTLIALLICVANVASLLFLRALRRRHEIAVRLALGISRPRLIGQLVTESTLIAIAAGVLSIAVAYFGGRWLRVSLLSMINWPATVVGLRGVILLIAIAVVAGVSAGLLPAFFASNPRIMDTLKTGTARAGQTHAKLRGSLIVLQAAMCVVLLVCSGVFVQSLRHALALDLGFDADRIVDIRSGLQPTVAQAMLPEVSARLASVPGVERVSVSAGESLEGSGYGFDITLATGDTIPTSLRRQTSFNIVDSAFFRAEGIGIVRGRMIDARDAASSLPVAVVSERMASALWGATDPIGQCFRVRKDVGPCIVVVGIARDVRTSVTGPASLRGYFPLSQPPIRYYKSPPGRSTYMGQVLSIRLSRPPTPAQLQTIRAIANTLPSGAAGHPKLIQPLAVLAPEIAPWRVAAMLFSGFGIVTLFLAGVGLYGLVGYDMACRTRELGVRIALGAQSPDILGLVLGSGLRVAVIGSVAGVAAAVASVRVIASLLFETSPADPLVLTVVVAMLIVVALAASLVPAWRATRIDPIMVLRSE